MFSESSGRNATYRSTDSVVGFVEALGTLVERSLLKKNPESTILQPNGW